MNQAPGRINCNSDDGDGKANDNHKNNNDANDKNNDSNNHTKNSDDNEDCGGIMIINNARSSNSQSLQTTSRSTPILEEKIYIYTK